MAIRKSKEKNLQFDGSIKDARDKCLNALLKGGFKKIEENIKLQYIKAKFNNFFVVGYLEIELVKTDNTTSMSLKSTANADNIFALFSSPNDKIMNSFIKNFI